MSTEEEHQRLTIYYASASIRYKVVMSNTIHLPLTVSIIDTHNQDVVIEKQVRTLSVHVELNKQCHRMNIEYQQYLRNVLSLYRK